MVTYCRNWTNYINDYYDMVTVMVGGISRPDYFSLSGHEKCSLETRLGWGGGGNE